eukprot:COSAG02_NODE_62493_length_265_cov_2.271084_1_plen_28_part_10
MPTTADASQAQLALFNDTSMHDAVLSLH